jgi:hypothetical protein
MREALKKFEEHEPEVVFEWHDVPGERGWVVIDNLPAEPPVVTPHAKAWIAARWRAWRRRWR